MTAEPLWLRNSVDYPRMDVVEAPRAREGAVSGSIRESRKEADDPIEVVDVRALKCAACFDLSFFSGVLDTGSRTRHQTF